MPQPRRPRLGDRPAHDRRLRVVVSLDQPLLQLYPDSRLRALQGLYLDEHWRKTALPGPEGCFVYANFVASLDGRIAVATDEQERLRVPDSIANPRDWRLYLELAAQADALLISGRYVRELATGTAQAGFALGTEAPDDLLAFRAARGWPTRPALAVLSASLDLPLEPLAAAVPLRRTLVLTCAASDTARRNVLTDLGCEVLVAGERDVEAILLLQALMARHLPYVYAIAGPGVLRTLVAAGRLNRLYLTTVFRLLGGQTMATLLTGQVFDQPPEFVLREAYLDQTPGSCPAQLLQVFDCLSARPSGGQLQETAPV